MVALSRTWACIPALVAAAVYCRCATYSEWYIDELFAVLRNEDARGESTLAEVFTNDFWGTPLTATWTHKSYRPLSVMSFSLQFLFLGHELFRPQPLRVFNIALHAVNSALVFALIRTLRIPSFWSVLAACWFAAHPVHVENIVYLVGRADMLATTGWLLAALLQARVHRDRRKQGRTSPEPLSTVLLLGACVLIAALAGLCKESGFTVLVFTAGFEFCTKHKTRAGRIGSVVVGITALALFALIAVARFRITRGAAAPFGFTDTPVQYQEEREIRTWSYFQHHAMYARLLLLPGQLCWDYSFDSIPLMRACWQDVRALAVCSTYLSIAALSALSLAARKSRRRVLLGLQTVIVPFVPASNLFFTVGVTVGERLLYPSTVGSVLVMSSLGHTIEGRRGRSWWLRVPGLVLLLVYMRDCHFRVWQWRSSEALFEADAKAWPNSVKTRHQVATVYHARNLYAEALENYNASLQVLNDNALTDFCIAQIYIETGQFPAAMERFEIISRGHFVGFSHFNLYMFYVDYGFALVSVNRFEEAIEPLRVGLKRNAALPHGQNALGFAYVRLNQLQEAQDAFATGLEYDPDNALIWNNLACVWMIAGAFDQAEKGLQRALELEPETAVIHHNAIVFNQAVQSGGAFSSHPRLELFFTRLI